MGRGVSNLPFLVHIFTFAFTFYFALGTSIDRVTTFHFHFPRIALLLYSLSLSLHRIMNNSAIFPSAIFTFTFFLLYYWVICLINEHTNAHMSYNDIYTRGDPFHISFAWLTVNDIHSIWYIYNNILTSRDTFHISFAQLTNLCESHIMWCKKSKDEFSKKKWINWNYVSKILKYISKFWYLQVCI